MGIAEQHALGNGGHDRIELASFTGCVGVEAHISDGEADLVTDGHQQVTIGV